jgi:hypothetical protein
VSVITFRNNKKGTEGFGSLYQRELFAYFISLFFNFNFQRSRLFFYLKHKKNLSNYNGKYKTIINKFNKLFNFFNTKTYNYLVNEIDNINNLKKKRIIYNVPFHVSEKFFSKLSTSIQKNLVKKFRKKFWYFNKKIFIKKKNKIIVLHIRNKSKADIVVGEDSFTYQLFTNDYMIHNNNYKFYSSWFFNVVKKIMVENKLSKKCVKIYVCSVGKRSDFSNLYNNLKKIAKTQLVINKDEYKTFKLLINADYFIMSQSSFSYLASFINRGSKYIRNSFRHVLPYDVNIIKDYELQGVTYLDYVYTKIGELFFKLRLYYK